MTGLVTKRGDLSQGVDTFFYVLGGVYLLYVLILILRAYSDLRAMPYLGQSTEGVLWFRETLSKCRIEQVQ